MATKYLTNRTEVEDFVRGATFWGTGGGGIPANGIESLMSEIEAGTKVGWVDVSEISDDAVTVCPFLMGSIAPKTPEVIADMEFFGLTESVNKEKDRLGKAIQALGKFANTTPTVVVPIELGGANTPGGIAAGCANGLTVVDGDYTGRAIPEIQQTTPYLAGKTLWPVSSVDEFGNVCYIEEAINYVVVERIGKLIASGAYGLAGQAGFLLSGKDMKECLIPGTLSQCYETGKMIREAREAGEDPVAAIIEKMGAWCLGKGTVTAKDQELEKLDYYWGTHTITGTGEYEGNTYKIWFKNENHVLWKNDEPFVTSPDIISVVNAKTGEPYPNPLLAVGEEVAIIGMKARDQFRTDRGVGILGPRFFRFDFDYVPIEERLAK